MKIGLSIIFLLVFFAKFISAQNTNWQNTLSTNTSILTYGIEDKSTIHLIDELLKDTANIIFIDDYSNAFLTQIVNKEVYFWGGQSIKCNILVDSIHQLYNTGRFFGSPFTKLSGIEYLKLLENEDQTKFDSIAKNHGFSDEKIFNDLVLNENQIRLVNDMILGFKLNSLDSLIFQSAFRKAEISMSDLNKIFSGKNLIFIYSITDCYSITDGNIIETIKTKNIQFVTIAKDGNTKRYKGYVLSIKNRIKRNEDFAEISFERLPRKFRLTTFEKIHKKQFQGMRFIYVNKLENCFYD
jgi:hypothetical protein